MVHRHQTARARPLPVQRPGHQPDRAIAAARGVMESGGLHAQRDRDNSSGGDMKKACCSMLLSLATLGGSGADAWKLPAEKAQVKPAPGAPRVIANCSLCHSADYISTQPPLSRAAWKATVEKMRLKYGAPIV